MTFGIAISNERGEKGSGEAVVVTDKQTTGSSIKDTLVNKQLGLDYSGRFHGVVFWAAWERSIITSLEDRILPPDKMPSDFPGPLQDPFKDYVKFVETTLLGMVEEAAGDLITQLRAQARTNSGGYTDESHKDAFLARQGELAAYRANDLRARLYPVLAFAVYDEKEERVRMRSIMPSIPADRTQPPVLSYLPPHSKYIEVGSNQEQTRFTLVTRADLNKDPRKLTMAEMIFYGCLSYSNALWREGFGGTPDITLITKKGIKHLGPSVASLISNLVNAHSVDYDRELLDEAKVIGYIASILRGNYKPLEQVADIMGYALPNLQAAMLPTPVWREMKYTKIC